MKIAIVGTGIAGLAVARLLHDRADIVVYERERRIGGHSNTVMAEDERGRTVPVDTGFIVYNEATYPNLVAMFDHLGVESAASDMSFSVSADGGRLEYIGDSLGGMFAQRRNLFRPGHWSMIRDILRFYREAPGLFEAGRDTGLTLGQFLERGGYSRPFVDDHLLPMGAAIWSSSVADMMGFPVLSFARFFQNHGLLKVKDRPEWRTVTGGSRAYVEKLIQPFADRIRTGAGAVRVRRHGDGVLVVDRTGSVDRFDQVVLACHADQSLALLSNPSPEERRVLSAFRYQPNDAILHRDPRLMPRRRRAWASWNYLADRGDGPDRAVTVTYWMNRLQPLATRTDFFVTLNPSIEPDPALVIRRMSYEHPVFDRSAMDMQSRIGEIQGADRVWYCGAWCGWGFHEDGLASGIAVAEALGARRPWLAQDASPAAANALPNRFEWQIAAE